jgi:vacuolar protein sorting-associated protein 18
LFLATSRNFLLRHDASGPPAIEMELSKHPEARVRRLFVDPLGLHALVAVQTGSVLETYYVDHTLKAAKPLPKLRNLVITSVGWPTVLRGNSLSEVLLGSDKGILYVLSLDEAGRKEKLQHLYALPGSHGPIAGLAQINLLETDEASDAATSSSKAAASLLILALCGTQLHIFRGSGTLEAVFGAYDPTILSSRQPKAFDLPIEQGAAQLQLLYPAVITEPLSQLAGSTVPFRMPRPTDFAVLSTSGVYYGRLDLVAENKSDELDHLVSHKLLPAAVLQQQRRQPGSPTVSSVPSDRPLSLALTQYHLALLYPSRLQFVNRISKRTVQEIPLERFAAPLRGAAALPLGLCRDALAGRVVVLAGDDAFEIDASDEDRDMWKAMLDRGDYRSAVAFCRSARQRNSVYLAEADASLAEGRAVEAGKLYGRVTASEPPFEELVLRLMGYGDPEALLAFLRARLGTLGVEDRPQATMVATWLIELLLDRANRAALQRSEGPEAEARCEAANQEVAEFLADNVNVLDPKTTSAMLEGYGREEDLLVFAKARGDYEQALECLIRRREAERALELLRHPSASVELTYRFAPHLVTLAPAQTVQAWMEASPALNPSRLLPALLPLAKPGAPPAMRAEALRFARYCFERHGSADSALHNLVIALFALDPGAEDDLLRQLASARDPLDRPLYDPVHALRLCQEHGHLTASVTLLCELELWEEAVELALQVSDALAADVARKAQAHGDEELVRRLWLAIAKRAIGNGLMDDLSARKEQVNRISSLLEESDGMVRIEDVLPMFPDFVEIGAFKAALCASLERHTDELERLRGEMAAASKTTEELRDALERVTGREASVDATSAVCARCKRPLLQQPPATAGPSGGALPRMFVFPTGNAFHGACLCAEVADLVPAPQRRRILDLSARLAKMKPDDGEDDVSEGRNGEPSVPLAELLRQLDREVASEDPYCGEIVARHVRRPLILPEEAAEVASWEL